MGNDTVADGGHSTNSEFRISIFSMTTWVRSSYDLRTFTTDLRVDLLTIYSQRARNGNCVLCPTRFVQRASPTQTACFALRASLNVQSYEAH